MFVVCLFLTRNISIELRLLGIINKFRYYRIAVVCHGKFAEARYYFAKGKRCASLIRTCARPNVREPDVRWAWQFFERRAVE